MDRITQPPTVFNMPKRKKGIAPMGEVTLRGRVPQPAGEGERSSLRLTGCGRGKSYPCGRWGGFAFLSGVGAVTPATDEVRAGEKLPLRRGCELAPSILESPVFLFSQPTGRGAGLTPFCVAGEGAQKMSRGFPLVSAGIPSGGAGIAPFRPTLRALGSGATSTYWPAASPSYGGESYCAGGYLPLRVWATV